MLTWAFTIWNSDIFQRSELFCSYCNSSCNIPDSTGKWREVTCIDNLKMKRGGTNEAALWLWNETREEDHQGKHKTLVGIMTRPASSPGPQWANRMLWHRHTYCGPLLWDNSFLWPGDNIVIQVAFVCTAVSSFVSEQLRRNTISHKDTETLSFFSPTRCSSSFCPPTPSSQCSNELSPSWKKMEVTDFWGFQDFWLWLYSNQ